MKKVHIALIGIGIMGGANAHELSRRRVGVVALERLWSGDAQEPSYGLRLEPLPGRVVGKRIRRRSCHRAPVRSRAVRALTAGGYMVTTNAILSNAHGLPSNDIEVERTERPSGFQPAPRSCATDEAAVDLRSRGGWTIVEQFVEHGFRYRLLRRPVEQESDASRLTKREREVIALALEGHGNKSIAYALGVSPSTIGVLIFRAAAKLGVKSRSELLSAYGRQVLTRAP